MRRQKSGRPAANHPELPFAEAEGTRAELKNMLGIALLRAESLSGRHDIWLNQLCLWVFNVTDATGRKEPLRKSYAELGSSPWGLCCSPDTVADRVAKARRLGLLKVTETWLAAGIQGANEYRVDWTGVRRLIGVLPPLLPADPPLLPADPPLLPADPPLLGAVQTKEYTSSHLFSPSESESDCQRPRMASDNRGPEPRMAQRVPGWLDEVPEVREARSRRIAPLPPAGLVYGAFDSLREDHLANGSLVPWFRRQLGCQRPVTTDSEAELILVLAAGLAAAGMPAAEVTKSRCGIFVATVNRALWPKVLKHVPAARKLLDQVLDEYPEALSAADGLGVQIAAAEVSHA